MVEVTEHPAFPMPRTCPFDPPPGYESLREPRASKVTLPDGSVAWVLTRHEDIRAMLADPRFSSNRANPGFPLGVKERPKPDEMLPFLINMDPPEHGPARRAVLGEFTVRRMEALSSRIQQIIDEALDVMLAGPRPADLVSALALPMPSLVICELLGVPYSDHDFFQARTSMLLDREIPLERRRECVDELRTYLDELITDKRAVPSDDLLGRQIRKQRETGEVDHTGLVGLGMLLLIAGHETTANMISLGTLVLLEHPDQLDLLRTDVERMPDAVEEMLRYFTIAESATARVAVSDVEIAGVVIRTGEGVLGLSGAGNRDPSAFDEPDEFRLTRPGRHHLSFGFGPHQCLGQNLARMELRLTFETLFRRVPTLRLAVRVEDLPFKDGSVVYGVHELPVTW